MYKVRKRSHDMLLVIFSLIFFIAGISGLSAETGRNMRSFNDGWLFSSGDSSEWSKPELDDSKWRKVSLPHDWSIEGDFSSSHPAGAGGGALPSGIGWYRKHFKLDAVGHKELVWVDFDGVYMNSTVYIICQAR